MTDITLPTCGDFRRGMDDQNNLLIATFDANGRILGQTTRNINVLLSQMDRLGYQQQGRQFGDLTASGLGLMSGEQNADPFIQQMIETQNCQTATFFVFNALRVLGLFQQVRR